MARPASKAPTDAELEVLQVIWNRGPCTLREVHEALGGGLTRASVFNRLEALVVKRLLSLKHRSKGEGGAMYVSTRSSENVLGQMFRRLTTVLGGGSAKAFFQGLLRGGELNERELRELRELLSQRQSKGRKGKD